MYERGGARFCAQLRLGAAGTPQLRREAGEDVVGVFGEAELLRGEGCAPSEGDERVQEVAHGLGIGPLLELELESVGQGGEGSPLRMVEARDGAIDLPAEAQA